MVILAFLPMGMERLLPTGKQRFVCDRFFEGEIAWGGGGGDFHGCLKNTKKRKKEKENNNNNNKNKQTNKISMTVPGVISMG